MVTPNIPEAEALTGRPSPTSRTWSPPAARCWPCGPRAVLVKGGHLAGARLVDVLVTADGVDDLRRGRASTRQHPRHRLHLGLGHRRRSGPRHAAARRRWRGPGTMCRSAIATAPGLGKDTGRLNHGHTVRPFEDGVTARSPSLAGRDRSGGPPGLSGDGADPQIHWPLLDRRTGRSLGQAREPHAGRRVQTARRTRLYAPACASPMPEVERASSRRPAATTDRASPLPQRERPARGDRRAGRQHPDKNAAMRALAAELIEYGDDFQEALGTGAAHWPKSRTCIWSVSSIPGWSRASRATPWNSCRRCRISTPSMCRSAWARGFAE